MSTMESNFDFLQGDWPEFAGHAKAVERLVHIDARGACIRARFLAEQVVLWMYEFDEDLAVPPDNRMGSLIHEMPFKKITGYKIFSKIDAIRRLGNIAAHDRKTISERDALTACREAFHLMYWLWSTYSDGQVRPDIPFDPGLIPTGEGEPSVSEQELQALQAEIESRSASIKEMQRQLKEKDEALARRNREIKQMRLQSKRFADNHDYNEAETRQFLIDVLLRESGWDPAAPNVREYEVEGMPESTNPSGKGYVDYVLWDDNGKPLALVEAKRTTRSYEEGQHQAKLYADCLEQKFGVRPVIFLTNGYEIHIWDDARYPIREVMGFYDKASLQKLFFQKKNRKELHLVDINEEITERYYQKQAIQRVGERFQQGHREALLVMATGTGKTRTSISITDVLLRYNWAKRVLFLADRNALVKQAYGAYAEHLPEVPIVNLVEEKNDTAARVVFSTYPTMLNQIERMKEGRRVFDVGHFDLVITDEAHRSIYNKYGAIFDYFDALLLGLTATPKGEVDRNTYQRFSHPQGQPTSYYELDQAVEDGFLVPPRKLSVTGKFLSEGISYDDLSPEEQEEYDDLFTDDETGQVPPHIDAGQLNSWLFNENTVEQVLKQLMSDGIKVEGGDRLGKTIIFAKNQKHADFIRKVFDRNFPQYRGHFAKVIHNKVEHVQSLINSFCSKDKKEPTIAISVDMMDTGIDAPDVVNLVFFKPVRSKTKFYQMIGRGTRLRPDLFGPGMDKEKFLIFDYCGNFEFFNENPDGYEPTISPSLGCRLFGGRLRLAAKLRNEPYKRDEGLQEFRSRILDQLHQAVESLEEQSVMVRPHLQIKHRLSDRSVWDHLESNERREIVEKLGEVVQIGFEDKEDARRFDLLILNLQHELLDGVLGEKNTKERVIQTGEQLHSKAGTVPAVRKVESTIREVISDEFWAEPSILALETVRTDLRELMHLIERKKRTPVYSNFTDQFGEAREVATGWEVSVDRKRYERRIRAFIEGNKHHLVIEKIRNARPLTDQDIQALEEFLFEADPVVSKERFYEVLGEDLNLVEFIRSVAGLSRQAVMEVFGEFLHDKRLSSTQIQFIQTMIDFYTQNGSLKVENLYEEPFNFIHEAGLDGVFEDKANVIELIIDKVERLNETG